MPITMSFERMGQLALAKGQSVRVGWQLFADELPPVIDHTKSFGFDSGRHIMRVSALDHEGAAHDMPHGAFYYTLTNVSTGPARVITPQHYIFFKATP